MFRKTFMTLSLMTGLVFSAAQLRADDDDKADRLRAEAKKLLAEARELKEAGKDDRAEQVAREAKDLLAAADEISRAEKKPKEEKEPKKEKVEKTLKPQKHDDDDDDDDKPVKKGEEPKHVKGEKIEHDDKPVKKGEEPKHVKGEKFEHDDKPVKKGEEPKHVKGEKFEHGDKPVKKEAPRDEDDKPVKKGEEPRHEKKVAEHEKPVKEPVKGFAKDPAPYKDGGYEPKKQPGPGGHPMEAKMMHLAQAAKHLREAGAADVAEHLERQIGQMKQQMMEQHHGKGQGGGSELHQVIQELRHEVASLREEVRRLQADKKK